MLGFPEVSLALRSDRPDALVAVRLCAVAPDGSSLLITRGVLNLTHRDGHASPAPLEPGRRYDVSVRLDAIAQAIPAGHRLRRRRLDRVLAVGLAVAGARHAHHPRRRA